MKELFELLKMRPLGSIIVMGAIILTLIIVFREVIRLYLIKKFELYTAEDLKDFAVRYAHGYFIDITKRQRQSIEEAYQSYKKQKKQQ